MSGITHLSSNSDLITISNERLFTLFSIFFISTVSFIFAILSMALNYSLPFLGPVWQFTFSIFIAGYLVVLVNIIIYYSLRLSKAVQSIYEQHTRVIKISALIIVLVIISVSGSILSINDDQTLKTIGTIGLMVFVPVIIIILEPITAPVKLRINNWINQKTGQEGQILHEERKDTKGNQR